MLVEEEFENVMLNIEMQVVSVANQYPELRDWQVDKVFNAFLSKYKALSKGREAKEIDFSSPAKDLFLLIEGFCDFFTGDSEVWEGDFIIELDVEKVSYENMVAIFKRLRKSVRTWTKRGGRKGYIYYIAQFLPEFSAGNQQGENPVIDKFIDDGLKNL